VFDRYNIVSAGSSCGIWSNPAQPAHSAPDGHRYVSSHTFSVTILITIKHRVHRANFDVFPTIPLAEIRG